MAIVMWMAAAYQQTHSPSWLAATWRSVYIHQVNWVNSCDDFGHDDNNNDRLTAFDPGQPG